MQGRGGRRALAAAGALAIGCLLAGVPAIAQVSRQPIPLTQVDVEKMAAGYRASRIVGSTVVNDQGEKVGTIDDLIIEPNEMVPYAILAVGGFLGVGDHLVVVPLRSLMFSQSKIELPGATKDMLRAMPEFSYSK